MDQQMSAILELVPARVRHAVQALPSGIGAEFVNSVTNRDYTLIMALTIIYGAFIIIANIATDLISAAIDPRVRLK